jgi:ferredoxin
VTSELTIEPRACIRCAACVNVAPDIFILGREGAARVKRQPATPCEERRSLAATLNCPTGAIRLRDQLP